MRAIKLLTHRVCFFFIQCTAISLSLRWRRETPTAEASRYPAAFISIHCFTNSRAATSENLKTMKRQAESGTEKPFGFLSYAEAGSAGAASSSLFLLFGFWLRLRPFGCGWDSDIR